MYHSKWLNEITGVSTKNSIVFLREDWACSNNECGWGMRKETEPILKMVFIVPKVVHATVSSAQRLTTRTSQNKIWDLVTVSIMAQQRQKPRTATLAWPIYKPGVNGYIFHNCINQTGKLHVSFSYTSKSKNKPLVNLFLFIAS